MDKRGGKEGRGQCVACLSGVVCPSWLAALKPRQEDLSPGPSGRMRRSVWTTYVAVLVFLLPAPASTCQHLSLFSQGPGYLELMNSPTLKAWGRQQLRVIFRQARQPGDRVRVIQESPDKQVIFDASVTDLEYLDTNRTNKPERKYSAEYLRADGTVISKTVLADWSGWMYCLHEYLGKRSVGKVLFPGTHNSGSYRVPKRHHTISPATLVNRYIYTQDESVEDQLERGARYLDLRIGHYPNRLPIFSDEIWWINHDVIKIRPLRKILQQIKSFLSRWPNEIIIVDLHRFPVGFKDEKTHDALAKFLVEQLGDLLHRPSHRSTAWAITFDQLWKTQARVLLSYSRSDTASKHNFYPPVAQIWADTDDQTELFRYLNRFIPRSCTTGRMSAAMAQLTPRASGIIKEKYGGLRGMAHYVNANITLGFALDRWGDTAQAAAVDYLSSTGIVSAAVLQNVRRAHPDHTCY